MSGKKIAIFIVIGILVVGGIVGGVLGVNIANNNKKVATVEEMIADLPDNAEYYLAYQQEIVDAYTAYKALSESLQANVKNSRKLFNCIDYLEIDVIYKTQQNLEFTDVNGGYSVKVRSDKTTALSGDIEIPATYMGKPVTTIPKNAFLNCTHITSIIIPDSVTEIGAGAFGGCTSLTEITIPFVGKNMNPDNPRWAVFGYIFGDDNNADDNMSRSSTIYKTSGTSGYTSQVSENSGYYYYYAIPKSLRKVNVTLQSNVDNYVFNNCDLIEEIVFTNQIKKIGDYSFANCTELKAFTIPSTVGTIGEGAFMNCLNISSVDIPEGVTSIGNYAFLGLGDITSVVVPDSVKSIGSGAFNGWVSLKEITLPFVGKNMNPENPRWSVFGYIFGDGDLKDAMEKSSTIYKTSGTSGFTSQVAEGSAYYFYYAIPKSLRKVTITTQTRVPDYSFNNCDLLEEIVFKQEVRTVGNHSFANCSELKEFDLSSALETIEEYAFYNCTRFTSVSIPEGVTSIGEYAFNGLSNITEIVIPTTVKNIGSGAFGGCSSLQEITIPFVGKNMNPDYPRWSVLGYIFGDGDTNDNMERSSTIYKTSGTSGFTSQVAEGSAYYFYYAIPKSLRRVNVTVQTSVPNYAFNNCDLLETITYTTITSTGTNAFANCSATIVKTA